MCMIKVLFLFQRSLAGWYTPHCAMNSNDQLAVIGPGLLYGSCMSEPRELGNMDIEARPAHNKGCCPYLPRICSLYAIKSTSKHLSNIAHAAVPTHMIVLPINELSNIDIPSNEEPKKGQV